MKRDQIENLYLVNGLGDFTLRNLGDLMKVHGINARALEGYSTLLDEDKEAYETFIVRYMNAHGLSYRASICPKKVYRACDKGNSYLRIDLSERNEECWLHIINQGKEWY